MFSSITLGLLPPAVGIWASKSMKHDYLGRRHLRQSEGNRFCWKLVYTSIVVLPALLYFEGTCFTEHLAHNTAGTAAGKVLLLNLEGELLADNPRAGNLSLTQAELLWRVCFCISCSVNFPLKTWVNVFQMVSIMVLPTNRIQGKVTELISKSKRKGSRIVCERRKRRNPRAL